MLFRLLKPDWANPRSTGFVKEIPGPVSLEGNFSEDFLKEKNQEGYGIYYFPNYPSQEIQGRPVEGKDIDVFSYIFVDMDLKSNIYTSKQEFINLLNLQKYLPSKIVDSGNGIHAYWTISDLTPELYVEFQLRLIQLFKTDNIHTILRIMRCPNYFNTKDPNNFKLAVEQNFNHTYSTQQIKDWLPELTEESQFKLKTHLRNTYEKTSLKFNINYEELPKKFKVLLEQDSNIRELFENPEKAWGDRSRADMSLCNLLYSKKFLKYEALQILYNTKKAISRSPAAREKYAFDLVDKIYNDRPKTTADSIAELEEGGNIYDLGTAIHSSPYFDCNEKPWRQKQILGLVGSPGVGKTSVTLSLVKDALINSDENYIALYFSLEMSAGEIIERWNRLTDNDPKLKHRLCLVTNENKDGSLRHLNIQDIYDYAMETKLKRGKELGIVVVDHINILNPTLDTRKYPNFGLESYNNSPQRELVPKEICSTFKHLAKDLNCFMLVQSQTTKSKAGDGDSRLGQGAAYGAAQFEWFADYIITIWQPLRMASNEMDIKVLCWELNKNRHVGVNDKVKIGYKNLLQFDIESGKMRPLTPEEYSLVTTKLQEWENKKKEVRGDSMEINKYQNSPTTSPNLKLVKNENPKNN